MKKLIQIFFFSMLFSLLFAVGSFAAQEMADGYTMGVSYYDPDEWEGIALREYLDDYIGTNFNATFYYNSERIDSAEDEIEFVKELHELGVQGLISTMSTYVEEVLPVCEEYGMYYMLAYVTITDEVFEAIKDNPYFLGVVGPSSEDETLAGESIAAYLSALDEERNCNYLVVTGGSSIGNEKQRLRTVGILTKLAELYDLTYDKEVEELASLSETTTIETGTNITVTILPGYLTDGAQVTEVLEAGNYNAVASCMTITYAINNIVELEAETGMDIKIGMVDCFTDQNYAYFNEHDSNGDSKLNALVGKYGAAIAPAFVAMCNAYAGYSMDFKEADGSAFWLHQALWYAGSTEEFNEQYALSIGITENTYSAVDMMKVLKLYNADADLEAFAEFTEK